MNRKSIMLIAGEPSGDRLAADLVMEIRRQADISGAEFDPDFFGAGGPLMKSAGVRLTHDMTEHSVIGLFEVLKKYGDFKRIFDQLTTLACERTPDVIICVDFSGFNRRFAHRVRKLTRGRSGPFRTWSPRIVQYVSPQVWASRPGRLWTMVQDLDLLLSILPFEKKWYADRAPGFRVEYVGHPMLDRFPVAPNQSVPDAARKRIVLLPGSRRDEIRRHLPILEETAMAIQQVCPAEFITVFPNQEAKNFAAGFSANSSLIRGQVGDLGGALTGATLAIASTGTVTMECALFGVPTVAMYRTSWLTYWIGRAIVTVDYLAMPNLLANAPVFPELIQAEATPEKIAAAALDLLNNPLKIGVVRSKLKEIIQSLGGPGASARAASAVLGLLKN